jgi:hypothetical protein
MAVSELLSVTFHATTYSKTRKGFRFPKDLKDIFGVESDGEIALLITSLTGETLFCGTSKFISGAEITEAEPCRNLDFSQEILVTASRAPSH